MKITLDASIKEHREIAELFRYQFVSYFYINEMLEGKLIGINYNSSLIRFVVNSHLQPKITIDLDQAQMDLRMALGTGIEFRAIDRYGHIINGQIIRISNDPITSVGSEIISVMERTKIYKNFNNSGESEIRLCTDYLKSVGVELEE